MKTARGRGRARVAAPVDEGLPHLVFEVNGGRCVLPLLAVREIVGIHELRRPPSGPPALRGTLSLRGATVPVVDLAAALGGDAAAPRFESCALVVDAPESLGSVIALAVDAVTGVAALTPAQIAPASRLGSLFARAAVDGMARVDEDFLPVLGLARVLEGPAVRAAVDAGRSAA